MKTIILFDGVCNLCNSSINFVIDKDKHKKFTFGSLQNIDKYSLPIQINTEVQPDSIIVIKNNKLYTRSSAALQIAKELPFPYPVFFYAGMLIPPFFRNFLYDWVAKNRYRWFGKMDTCRMPTPDLEQRFL